MSNEHKTPNTESTNEPICPLIFRTNEEREARDREWIEVGLMYPAIRDRLVDLLKNKEEMQALEAILCSNESLVEANDKLNNYMMISGLVNGEIEFAYDELED